MRNPGQITGNPAPNLEKTTDDVASSPANHRLGGAPARERNQTEADYLRIVERRASSQPAYEL
jgi:hypothetical protein